ncbi:MAG: hypothetical protein RIQ89_153 [Bacteroidota bacterium]|jgi:hypothetical protein
MRSSIFQYPYEKVFKRTKGALSRLGLKVTDSNSTAGSIQAESGFSILKPQVKVDLIVEEMENHNTKVTVRGLTVKNMFFQKGINADLQEAEILETISVII